MRSSVAPLERFFWTTMYVVHLGILALFLSMLVSDDARRFLLSLR